MREYKGIPILRNSRRKTIAIYLSGSGNFEIRCPVICSDQDIMRFVDSQTGWIERHRQKQVPSSEMLSFEDLKRLGEASLVEIVPRVKYFAELMQVRVRKVTFKVMKSRWGSCSSNGNISLNVLLMLTPEKIRDAIVVHELCHRIHMNHSRDFYLLWEKHFPEYRECEQWLHSHGREIMSRVYE
ncbi:M48 family metallopeptidase [Succinimonas amylolytica]|uniref:M48 family metallopeptidase n=1 Tax=Succinimonas amylolytica TaxID=83769 RepID=UPI0023A88930